MLKMRDVRDELLWNKKQLPVAHTSVQLQDSSSYIDGNCVNCMLMDEKYQEASVELKSLPLINNVREVITSTY